MEFTTHTWAVKPLVHSSMLGGQGVTKDSAARTTEMAATAAKVDHKSRANDAGKRPTIRIFDSTSGISGSSNKFFASLGTKSPEIKGPPSERSPKSDDCGSEPTTPSKNSNTQPPPGSGLFGSKIFSSMGNVVSGSNTMSNNDASKNPSEGPFGSQTIQKGGIFGSTTAPAGGHLGSNTAPTGGLFGSNATTSSSSVYPPGDTAKPRSPSTFGSNTIASTSQTSPTTPNTGLFGSTSEIASPDSGVSQPLPSSLFGLSAVSSENDVSRATTPKGSGIFGSDAGSRLTSVSPSSGKSQLPLPSFAPFGSSTVPSGNDVSRASTPKGSPFDSSSKSSLHDNHTSKAPLSGLFGSTNTPTSNISVAGTTGGFAGFTSSSITSKSDTSKSPSLGVFGAPATSSNTDGGGLFGSNAGPTNHHTPGARSTGSIFDLPTKSDISKEKSPSTSNSSGFGSSSSAKSKIPATSVYFGVNNGSAGDSGSKNLATSRPFDAESISWASISKAAGSSSSPMTGEPFSQATLPPKTQALENTATNTTATKARPSSSTTASSTSGPAATITTSGPSPSLFISLGSGTLSSRPSGAFGASPSTSIGSASGSSATSTDSKPLQPAYGLFGMSVSPPSAALSGTNTTTPTNQNTSLSTSKTPKATASTPSNASQQRPISPIFGLTGATDTAGTFKPATTTTTTPIPTMNLDLSTLSGPTFGFGNPQRQTGSRSIRINLPLADDRRPSRSLPPPQSRDPTAEGGE